MAKTEPPADFDETLTVFVGNEMLVDERVFFGFDDADLRPRGRQMLDHIVELYQQTGGDWARLRVMGHADERGPASYNVALSERRAESVRAYLTAQGVPDALLDVAAYGESRPLIEDATTEHDYQLNRRVAFEIVREGDTE
jgi:outer membrane protein OmpA-like peptidoglycan-associated protein